LAKVWMLMLTLLKQGSALGITMGVGGWEGDIGFRPASASDLLSESEAKNETPKACQNQTLAYWYPQSNDVWREGDRGQRRMDRKHI